MPARVSVLPESPAEARVSAAHKLDGREIVRQPIFTMAAEEGRVVVAEPGCCCLLKPSRRPIQRLVGRTWSHDNSCVPESLRILSSLCGAGNEPPSCSPFCLSRGEVLVLATRPFLFVCICEDSGGCREQILLIRYIGPTDGNMTNLVEFSSCTAHDPFWAAGPLTSAPPPPQRSRCGKSLKHRGGPVGKPPNQSIDSSPLSRQRT